MTTPADVENLRPLFGKILQSHQLVLPQNLKDDQYKIPISDRGEFYCGHCYHTWNSMFSWITFDLRELTISRRWKMKCKNCFLECIPKFTVTQLQNMFDKAVKIYKGEPLSKEVHVGYRRRTYQQPHRPDLCEKCCWGLEQCWFMRYNF